MGDECFLFLFNNPTSTNTTNLKTTNGHEDGLMEKLQMITLSLFSIFVLTINVTLIIGLKNTYSNLTLSQKLYIYLSTTDSIIGGILLPYFVVTYIAGVMSCMTLSIGMALTVYSFGTGWSTFFTISTLRHLAIRKPLLHIEEDKVKAVLVGCNIYMVSKAVLTFFVYTPKFTSLYKLTMYWFVCAVFIFFETLLLTLLNFSSMQEISKQQKRQLSTHAGTLTRRNLSQRRAVLTLNLITLVYVICVLPFTCYYIVLAITIQKQLIETFEGLYRLFSLFHVPLFLCSGLNALMYLLKDKQMKRYFLNRFRLNGGAGSRNLMGRMGIKSSQITDTFSSPPHTNGTSVEDIVC